MRAALTMDVLATDLADYLVRKGVSFSMTILKSQFLMEYFRFPSERLTMFLAARLPLLKRANAKSTNFRWRISNLCTRNLLKTSTPSLTLKPAWNDEKPLAEPARKWLNDK
jgi:hypothetical protein